MKRILSIAMAMLVMLGLSITAYAIEANNVRVVTNGETTFLIESNGNVKGWGRNPKGEVGNGTTIDQYAPVSIEGLSNIRIIVPNDYGYGFFFAIDSTGQVYAWGYNGYGQLGLGINNNVSVPALVTGLPEISQIRINEYTVYAITTGGDVYATGENDYGQVGNGSKTTQRAFVKIPQLSGIRDIVCRSNVAYAISNDNKVFAWGKGNSWQLGIDLYTSAQTTPAEIRGLSGKRVDEIITNGVTTFAVCNDRQDLYSWGESWFGESGNYSETSGIPKKVTIISDLPETIDEFIIAGQTSFAVMSDGTLYGWGRNGYNELGNGGTFNKSRPEIIENIPKVKQFVFKGSTGIVLGVDGCVYSWGRNPYGEAGTGSQGRIPDAIKLTALGNNIERIFNGNNAMYAVNADGTVYGWGNNNKRQLAIGNTGDILPPTIIQGISSIVNLEKVNDTIFAADSQDIIYGWGENEYGQVGNNSIDNVAIPFVVSDNEMTTTTGTGEVNSTVPIVGEIDALELSFTHPLSIAYSIDPNDENGFYCPDIQIRNNSKVPVEVRIESFKACAGGDLVFEDVMPNSKDWSSLNRQETKSYIALGLQYVDGSDWLISQPELNDPLYAAQVDHTFIGVLGKESGAALRLSGYHGLAFDGNYSAKHELVFVVAIR